MAKLVPEFVATPADQIASIVKEKRLAYNTQITKPLEWRLKQLRKLYWRCASRPFRPANC